MINLIRKTVPTGKSRYRPSVLHLAGGQDLNLKVIFEVW